MKTINPEREALRQAARVLRENQYKLRNGFSEEDADKVEAVYRGLISNLETQLNETDTGILDNLGVERM